MLLHFVLDILYVLTIKSLLLNCKWIFLMHLCAYNEILDIFFFFIGKENSLRAKRQEKILQDLGSYSKLKNQIKYIEKL